MQQRIIIIFATIFMLVCGWFFVKKKVLQTNEDVNIATQEQNPYKDAELKVVVIPSESKSFGYDIYMNGTLLIHQPSRPGLPGNERFATEEDAMKVAELVIKKIRNNELPPSVTLQELQELGVLWSNN